MPSPENVDPVALARRILLTPTNTGPRHYSLYRLAVERMINSLADYLRIQALDGVSLGDMWIAFSE